MSIGIRQGIEGKPVEQASEKTGTWEAPRILVAVIKRLFLESINIKNKSASTGFCSVKVSDA